MFDIMPLIFTKAWIVIVGNVTELCAYAYYLIGYFVLFFDFFILFDLSCIRLLIDWVWQKPPPILDDFFFVFLTAWNATMSAFLVAMNALAKDDLRVFFNIQGIADLPDAGDFGKDRIGLLYKVLGFTSVPILLAIASWTLKKARYFLTRRKGQPPTAMEIEPPKALFNNSSRNKEVFGGLTQIVFILTFFVLVGPYIILVIFPDDTLTMEENAFLELSTFTAQYIFVPLFFYSRNPRLKNYFISRFKDIIHPLSKSVQHYIRNN